MSYKKHDWVRYGQHTDVIEIAIKDEQFGKTIDFFRTDNNGDFKTILKILKTKYGFGDDSSKVTTQEDINLLKKDLEW